MRAIIAFALAVGLSPPLLAEDSWYPSKYGALDTLGAIHNLSPAKVVEAAKLVRTGKTYALGVETGRDTPAFGTRSYQIHTMAGGDGTGATLGSNKASYNDDLLMTWLGIGSQIDGLGHLGIDHVYYNGTHVSEFLQPDGVTRFGTHLLPPIVTRGVLLDVAALEGVDLLPAGTAINRTRLEAAAKRQGVEIRKGDVVILHTGWQALAKSDPALGVLPRAARGRFGRGLVLLTPLWLSRYVDVEHRSRPTPRRQPRQARSPSIVGTSSHRV